MIVFKKITFANFLSVGNSPVSVDLNDTKTTLIHGTNGSGKSSVLDAICYALYNKPFRRINLPQLINTQNKKGLLVEAEFTIGQNHYIVQRGQKPKVFRLVINGEEFDKLAADKDSQAHLEQNILKLTYKSFCQVCILGSANYVPFMQLTTSNRRECIEDFLDIKVFSTMAIIAKERLRGLKEQINSMRGEIGNHEFKIEVQQERCDEIQKKAEESSQEYKDELKQISESIEKKRVLIERVEDHSGNVQQNRERLDKGNPEAKTHEIQKVIAKLEQKVERLQKENKFYAGNSQCPTCHQLIDEDMKGNNINENDKDINKNSKLIAEGEKVLSDFQFRLRLLRQRDRYLQALRTSLAQYHTEMHGLEDRGKRVVDKLRSLENDTGDYSKELGKLEVMSSEREKLQSRVDDLIVIIDEHEIVSNLLKDGGIKTQVVRKYLPVMNKLIRHYLTELDLPIHFKLDDEFNETVASPLHQNFSYASFSEGQKARIDLALMFTWREIGKLKNSVSTNLLILDEVFSSSLDESGKELLLALLRYKLPDHNNILVVDHTLSGEFRAKFERSIEVQQVKGFTKYD